MSREGHGTAVQQGAGKLGQGVKGSGQGKGLAKYGVFRKKAGRGRGERS